LKGFGRVASLVEAHKPGDAYDVTAFSLDAPTLRRPVHLLSNGDLLAVIAERDGAFAALASSQRRLVTEMSALQQELHDLHEAMGSLHELAAQTQHSSMGTCFVFD